jgi:hypothetical protein
MTTFDNKTGHKLSTVVPFRSRDVIIPKGIDGGEILAWASADELLALHLELTSEAKAFWKDGFLLYTLWETGDFCGMLPPRKRSTLYPYTRGGFYQFLRDHGSQISPEEASRNSHSGWSNCSLRQVGAIGCTRGGVITRTWGR